MKGIVFDIQHYCIHDGPGIRTNVFLKGCPLQCQWCQNPESQKLQSQIMHNLEKCAACGTCAEVCEIGAIRYIFGEETEKTKTITDRTKCTACGKCVTACLNHARSLAGKEMTVEDVFQKVYQDKLFFGDDGGITITGGEPLVQWEFAKELLKKCKDNEIHTCIETSGYADWDKVKALMEHVDLVLYDIKHMDSSQHKLGTGAGNERILDNIKKISQELRKPIIIRVPTIPGYNATVENMEAIGKFIKTELPTCQKVNLLPFHNMGESKMRQLEEKSDFRSRTPTAAEMQELREVIAKYGIAVK